MAYSLCLAQRPTDGKGFARTSGIRTRHRWDGEWCRWCHRQKAAVAGRVERFEWPPPSKHAEWWCFTCDTGHKIGTACPKPPLLTVSGGPK